MKKIFLYISLVLSLSACITVPEQAVTSQELVLSGIKTAQKNQIALINAYADDRIDNEKKIMSTVVLDKVLEKTLDGRKNMPAATVKQLILEYSEDLSNRIAKIEVKRTELLDVANKGYAELIDLSKSNLNFTKSLRKSSEQKRSLLGNYENKLKDIENVIKLHKTQN